MATKAAHKAKRKREEKKSDLQEMKRFILCKN